VFFRQRFAQVTNPPIDPLRESLVMSLHTWLGPKPDLLQIEGPRQELIELASPIIDTATLAAIRNRVAVGAYHDHQFQVLPLEGEMALVELHEQVIDNILGKRNPEDFLMYTRDAAQAVRWVDEAAGTGAFFLDTPDLRQVLKLAQEGKTLPQKSTYFYPKPPSGMVFLRLEPNRRL